MWRTQEVIDFIKTRASLLEVPILFKDKEVLQFAASGGNVVWAFSDYKYRSHAQLQLLDTWDNTYGQIRKVSRDTIIVNEGRILMVVVTDNDYDRLQGLSPHAWRYTNE